MSSDTLTLDDVPVSPKSTLSREQLLILLNKANEELEKIGHNISHLHASFKRSDDGGNHNTGETAERATNSADDPVTMIRTPRCQKYADKLVQAIEKISSGLFDDHCIGCDGVIPFERLENQPETTKCVPCKEKKA